MYPAHFGQLPQKELIKIIDWLSENIGIGSCLPHTIKKEEIYRFLHSNDDQVWCSHFCYNILDEYIGVKFYFIVIDQALLFKLTWGNKI